MRRRSSSRPSGASATISILVPPRSMPKRIICVDLMCAGSDYCRIHGRKAMRYCMGLSVAAACLIAASMASAQQLNVICSVQAEWCSAVANEFQRETGIKVGLTLKGSGESMAQLAAEKANPKLDVWFGGTGDPHLQAAEQDLTLAYKSPVLEQLQPWAKKQAQQSGYRTVGLYLGVLGMGYNSELLAKKKLSVPACWRDTGQPH